MLIVFVVAFSFPRYVRRAGTGNKNSAAEIFIFAR